MKVAPTTKETSHTSQTTNWNSGGGSEGAALVPPAYGIDMVDKGIIQRKQPPSPGEKVSATGSDTSGVKQAGNPGTIIGTEARDGTAYVRYKAEPGTWVSASLAQQGYDKIYGADTAYGAYLGIVLGADGKPLKTPDRIKPGQEYLVPVGTSVSFEADVITGHRQPQTQTNTETWRENPASRFLKDTSLHLADLPYGSFELKGPEPPSRDPREAVAFWLGLHKAEIAKAESDWQINRIAIAGVIAWEALNNPQATSAKSVGPGKMHLEGEEGQLSWPEVIEGTGRAKKLNKYTRKAQLKKPAVAIDYIGAAMDIMAVIAERYGWNIRNSPAILGQVYHSKTAEKFDKEMSTKPPNAPFLITPGMMGKWIEDNQQYLEDAVGQSELK